MNPIEKLLTGEMHMSEFLSRVKTDTELQEQLRNLVPIDAVNYRDHELWRRYSYWALAQYDFDFLKRLLSFHKLDLSLGDNLNIFSSIRYFYCYSHPSVLCTTMYEDAFDLYLDVIKDCYDGPEVTLLVDSIIQSVLSLKTKKARIATAKTEIENHFHISDKKRPSWIHGPEWPMGQNSPMKFISQKRSKERVEYIFEDFDTKEQRVIVQHY